MSAGRILIVDDEPQIRRIMRTTLMLIGAGYEVDDAKTGEEALEKVRAFRPELVLLDINMAGMGGLAACRAIRADTSIGIVMLTVRNSEADKVAALDAGADDFVTKPFSTPELLARIRAALRRAMSLDNQARPAGIAWEKLEEPRPSLSFEVVLPNGESAFYNLGPHPPRLWPDDVELVHSLWLELSAKYFGAKLHHRDVVRAALKRFEAELKSSESSELIEHIRSDVENRKI